MPRRAVPPVWRLLALGALLTGGAACDRALARPAGKAARAATPRAYKITRAAELLPGLSATGRLGDFRLDNGLVSAVVDKLGAGQGAAESGGNLVDLAPAGGEDTLWQVFTYFADSYPRQAIYEQITPHATAAEARVTVRGRDMNDPGIRVETSYVLAAGSRSLVMTTTIENHSPAALRKFAIGDVLQWGRTERFLPGHPEPAKGSFDVPWAAAVGERSSYLYAGPAGPVTGSHGVSWSDFIVSSPDIGPGDRVTVERFIAVGDRGDAASALDAAAQLAGRSAWGRLAGSVRELGTTRPAQALVVASHDGGQAISIQPGADGRFEALVPVGSYVLTTLGHTRAPAAPVTVVVRGGNAAPELALIEVGPPGEVQVTITSGGKPSAGKVTLEGIAGTPDPWLGPIFVAAGAANVAVTHDGALRVPAPPGRYRVTCSRGIEFDVDVKEMDVVPGAPTRLACDLRRAVDTPGRVAFDFHQHAVPSSDAGVSLRDRVVSDLAEGLEGFVASDHNEITDYGETVKTMGVADRILAITGNEATAENLGHFNAYPLQGVADRPRHGAPPVTGRSAAEIFAGLRALDGEDKVIQVNHPRAGKSGYFDRIAFDPSRPGFPSGWSDDFDAIEIVNGKRSTELPTVLADYFELLRRGKIATAVGNSDTHAIFGTEPGYPRNLVAVGKDDPGALTAAEVVRAVKVTRDVVVTNGPILEVQLAGVGPGGRVPAAKVKAGASVEIQVQAAPWVDVDKVEVLVNGRAGKSEAVPPSRAKVRFERRVTVAVKPGDFLVVIAQGSQPLHPVVPTEKKPVTPIAIANPIWITP